MPDVGLSGALMTQAKLAWVVRANPHHVSRITEFLKRDLIALGWPVLGSVAGKEVDEIKAALLQSYGKLDSRELGTSAGALDMLVNRMKRGPRLSRPDDLAVVCANCHAMLRRGGKCRQLDELIRGRRTGTHGRARER